MKKKSNNPIESHYTFNWDKLNYSDKGRKNLGSTTPVMVLRMLEYSLRHVLYEEFGSEKTDSIFREAGYLTGKEYAKNKLPLDSDSSKFLSSFVEDMLELKIGIVRVELADFSKGEFTIAIYEDMDCSGLPASNEVVCCYTEGLLSGVMESYLNRPIEFKEIDCWASGERVCRFKGEVNDDK